MEQIDVELPIDDMVESQRRSLKIIEQLKPDWELQAVQFVTFTEGITNKIFAAFPTERPDDKLVFRVYGRGTDKVIERSSELASWQKLASAGLAAKLYAKFANGLVCGYLPGKPLDVNSVRESTVQRGIANAMARLHSLPVGADEVPNLGAKLEQFRRNFALPYADAEKQSRFEQLLGDEDFDAAKATLLSEIAKIPADRKEVVFCHNDLLIYNILRDEESGSINFIDYEYAAPNYALFDIANHFSEWAGVDGRPNYALCPNRTTRLAWLDEYVRSRKDSSRLSGEKLHAVLPLFEAASHLFWSLWSLVQSQNSTIDFDYMLYAKERLQQYKLRMQKYLKHRDE